MLSLVICAVGVSLNVYEVPRLGDVPSRKGAKLPMRYRI